MKSNSKKNETKLEKKTKKKSSCSETCPNSQGSSSASSTTSSASTSSSSDENGLESWRATEEFTSQPLYRQMNLSVSRMVDGIQTDIRIRRETGHQTDIYVSQGSDSWSISPRELNQLPASLRQEVRMLLSPGQHQPLESWLGFFAQADTLHEDPSLLEGHRQSSGTCE